MTELTKVVRRATPASVRNRPIVIELHPWGVRVKEKGRRFGYDISYQQLYTVGAKLKADEVRREKAAAKAAKRKGAAGVRR